MVRGFNLILQKSEEILDPKVLSKQTSRGIRYFVQGSGSDGTKISVIVSKGVADSVQGGTPLLSTSPARRGRGRPRGRGRGRGRGRPAAREAAPVSPRKSPAPKPKPSLKAAARE